ncbi:MAG: hypothetical protein VW645_04750 [Betaproteobacteria bacterium]
MNQTITWGAVAGATGLIATLYFVSGTSTQEAGANPTSKPNPSVVLAESKGSNQATETPAPLDPTSQAEPIVVAKLDDTTMAPKNAADMIHSTLSSNKKTGTYASNNIALFASQDALQQAPSEVVADMNDRWLNINDGYLSHHTHWHDANRSDVTFENFTQSLYFFPADEKFSSVTAVCKNRTNYSEVLLYADGKKWFDLNQGGRHPDSVTLWDWYNTVAIRSGDQTFIEHVTPKTRRWNAPISRDLSDEILRTGQFEVYVEANPYRSSGKMLSKKDKQSSKEKPSLNLKTTVTIDNLAEVQNCFDTRKASRHDPIETAAFDENIHWIE